MESPYHCSRQFILQLPIACIRAQSPSHSLQSDSQKVENRPDQDEIQRSMPQVNEGKADGASKQFVHQGGGEDGDDWKINVLSHELIETSVKISPHVTVQMNTPNTGRVTRSLDTISSGNMT